MMEIITNTVNKAVSMGTFLPPRSFLVRLPLHPLGTLRDQITLTESNHYRSWYCFT